MIYRAAKGICSIVLATLRRWQIQGRENFPLEGGFLVVSNHTSYWDPVVIGCCMKKRICFMAKEELFRTPVFRSLLLALGSFPVKRDKSDRQAIRTALNLLKEGQAVGIFPEGTRNRFDDLSKAHLGAAMLALKAKVPVLPVAVLGTKGFLGKIKVKVGKPVFFENISEGKISKQSLESATKRIMSEIARLIEESNYYK